ncbi:PRTRC system protein E [Parabacteroides goldsteinii]|uniref:PRTRC system protein E n=1 Tax=Parabacteroides goldsteinii TaxID=328812 RepID=UPI0034A39E48
MFFTQINQLMAQSVDITMVIRKSATGMTVSVLPKSNGLKDEAQNHIVPLTLSGLPEELDAGFMNAIANPVRKVSGLLTNMAEFEKQADKAAANSKASKEQKAKETKEEKEKREKYEKHMKKAEELIAARNHKEAVTTLGQARLYATEQNRKTVDEKIEEQKRAMNQGSLFDLMEQTEQQPRQQAPHPVAEQKPVAQQPIGQVPPQQQPRQYVQQPPQQSAPQPIQGQQPVYHRQMPQQPYPYPQQGAYSQGAQGGQQHYEEQMPSYYTERQTSYQHPPYPPQDEPTYRPEDYEEYLDFPADMIQTPHYQHQTA